MKSLKVAFIIVLLTAVIGLLWELNTPEKEHHAHVSVVHAASTPACRVPTRDECQRLYPEFMINPQYVEVQSPEAEPASPVPTPKAEAPAAKGVKNFLKELTKIPGDKEKAKEKEKDKDKEKEKSGGASARGPVKNNFPGRTYRFVSRSVNIANGGEEGWIRLGFKFDGVTQLFTMEVCSRDPANQWPNIWSQTQTSLDSLYEPQTQKLWMRLPIVSAKEQLDTDQYSYTRNYHYGVGFDPKEIMNSQVSTMLFEHIWFTGGSVKTPVEIWQLERETEFNREWACDWNAVK